MAESSNRTGTRPEADRIRQQAQEVAGSASRASKAMADETSRTTRDVADRTSQAADSALRAGKDLTDETSRTAEQMASQASELAQQGSKTIQKGIESGLDMTARVAERSIEAFAAVTGIPTEETKGAAEHSLRNIRAIVDTGTVMMDAFQEAGREWLDRTNDRMRRNMDSLQAVLRSRNMTELAEAQTDLARRQIEGLITDSQRTTELVSKAVVSALQKIKATEEV